MDKSSLLWIFVVVACAVGSSGGTKKDGAARRVRSATGNDPGLHGLIGSFVKTGKRQESPVPPTPAPPICDNDQVCYEVLKTFDNKYQPSHLCRCTNGRVPPCDGNWQRSRGNVLTFRHYLRSDQTVQWKFCTAFFASKRSCQGAETAAIIREPFSPYARKLWRINCNCTDDRPFEFINVKNKPSHTDFIFKCQKPNCQEKDVCAEAIEGDGKFKQVTYKCNCPRNKECEIGSAYQGQERTFKYWCTPSRYG